MHEDEPIWGRDVVKRGDLLVTEEHVRNPDFLPAVVAQLQLGTVVISFRFEFQSTVVPLLSQVHTQREVLYRTQ